MLLQLIRRLLPWLPPEVPEAAHAPYFSRALNETPEQHSFRLNETEMLIVHWAQVHADWRDGRRTGPVTKGLPVWDGESLNGKTVLLHDWPGLGDSLNFVRYANDLKALGATVLLEVRPEAASLLSRVAGVDGAVTSAMECSFDFHVPGATLLLYSMLNHLQASAVLGVAEPYLAPLQSKVQDWSARLSPLRRPRIGLSWAGNPGNRNDAIRSIPLSALSPVIASAQGALVSLQVGAAAQQLDSLGVVAPILNLSSDLNDLEDTAAVIQHLDLVISVDSTVAHLAGGMGKPVWLLRSVGADRRWDVAVHPHHWYRGFVIYATQRPGDWSDTLAKVAGDIKRF